MILKFIKNHKALVCFSVHNLSSSSFLVECWWLFSTFVKSMVVFPS